MQTTFHNTAIPVVDNGRKRRTVLLAALAAFSVTLAIAITAATVTDGSSRPAIRAGAATPWVTPQHGPGSNSLSMTDAPPTPTAAHDFGLMLSTQREARQGYQRHTARPAAGRRLPAQIRKAPAPRIATPTAGR